MTAFANSIIHSFIHSLPVEFFVGTRVGIGVGVAADGWRWMEMDGWMDVNAVTYLYM